MTDRFSRRGFMAASAAMIGTGAVAQTAGTTELEGNILDGVKRNISSFRSLDWQPYFSNLRNGAVLVDIQSRALHYWSEDQSVYKLFPTSVPLTEDMTRKGRTSITQKVEGPSWAPTPVMPNSSAICSLYMPMQPLDDRRPILRVSCVP